MPQPPTPNPRLEPDTAKCELDFFRVSFAREIPRLVYPHVCTVQVRLALGDGTYSGSYANGMRYSRTAS